MNIKVKENAGSFEQSFAKMLDKIYGNNGNVKVEVKKTHDGTLYTVLNDFDQVDFLFKTDKGTKAPTCDITIGGDTLFTKTGDPKKKVKTYYGLFDEDPTILRSFQQILQKYIDGVDLDLPWLRFEESKKNEENETELSKLVKAYCLATGGEDAVPDKVEMVDKTTINDDGDVLLEFNFENEKENGTSGTTYALVCGDLYRNTDNDLLYFLHDWQSGEKVTPEDVDDHDWELANDVIKPSEILKESNKSEDKRNYYGYGKDEPIDKEDNDFMFQVAYDWFEKKLPRKLKDYADNAVNKVIDKDMRSYEEIETMDDYYDYLEKYGSDIVEEIKNDHADESKKSETGERMAINDYANKRFYDPDEFVKYVRKVAKDGSYLSVDSVVSMDILNKANRLAQNNGFKKSEADYSTSRVSKSIADAYKVLDDYYCDNDGSLRKGFVNQIMTTFVNDRDLYTRSQSKAVKSHSLAWDVLCRQINAHLEWDDETPHATKLTSEQVKNWFKLKGRDFKEDLKPLVDAIDAYRNKKESKGESMKNEANIEDLRNKSISHGTMRSEHLIPEFLGVLKIYAPDKYDAYVKANPEVLDLNGLDDETLGYIVEELFDALNDIAPEGTYFGAHPGDGSDYGFWDVEPDESKNKKPESKCGDGKDDKGKKPEESAKPVKNILRRRFEVLTKSVLHACDKLVKDASLAGEFDDEVIYAEDAVKNAIESFNTMGDAIVRLKTVLESHKNEDNMEIIGILSDAITKIVADEQGDETDAATAGADSVIDQVEREYGNEPENEPEANGEENEAPSPAGAEAPDEF